MRILAVADEVSEHLSTADIDVVVSCGDVPFDRLEALAASTEAPVFFVPGNHDPDLSGYRRTRAGLVVQAGIPVEPPWPPGTTCIDGRVVEVHGMRLAGLGGSLRYGAGPNQYSERQQARRSRRLGRRARRGPVDVLVAHAPIAGLGDGGSDDPVHAGFATFGRLVTALQPRLFLHGHVRPTPGASDHHLGPTRVVNVFDHQFIDLDGVR